MKSPETHLKRWVLSYRELILNRPCGALFFGDGGDVGVEEFVGGDEVNAAWCPCAAVVVGDFSAGFFDK